MPPEQLILAATAIRPRAYNFSLSISDACNMRCDYCFNQGKTGRLMDVDTALSPLERLFGRFPDGEKYFIDLSGKGEPLLNQKVIDAVASFAKKKSDELRLEVLPTLVSNGLLLNKERALHLQEEGVLFGVSLDGTKEIRDAHRRNVSNIGTYERIIANVRSIPTRDYVGCALTFGVDPYPLLDILLELR